ncbi:DUF4259 domain-containing protein [Actinoplanes flavus]|uniref:DUF4259 domain-containing protein n=1 Tax=Actinoplanes flavus TaxID=2820290 RepID=A0ABS3UUR9_9ACTN|nr:DUF4259 domain-containing protein [Actinoplanes flavus]MBO3742304.1 DUF4259 domain-containing protein [Actinoplanes flavus]
MGAWGFGPFDNDDAADWSGDLHEAAPGERAGLLRKTLEEALHEGEYLEQDSGSQVVAAAAVIASLLPGGTALINSYAADSLTEGGTLDLPGDLPALALRALDRVAGDDSEWAEQWEDGLPKALAALQPIREVLEAATA